MIQESSGDAYLSDMHRRRLEAVEIKPCRNRFLGHPHPGRYTSEVGMCRQYHAGSRIDTYI